MKTTYLKLNSRQAEIIQDFLDHLEDVEDPKREAFQDDPIYLTDIGVASVRLYSPVTKTAEPMTRPFIVIADNSAHLQMIARAFNLVAGTGAELEVN